MLKDINGKVVSIPPGIRERILSKREDALRHSKVKKLLLDSIVINDAIIDSLEFHNEWHAESCAKLLAENLYKIKKI